jgi:hypothetical protein
MTKFFMPPNIDEEVEERQWQLFNKQSNPDNADKFTNRVYAVREYSYVDHDVINKDVVGGNFPDKKIPICAIIETDDTFDIYGIAETEINGLPVTKSYLHQIQKSRYVIAEYFE